MTIGINSTLWLSLTYLQIVAQKRIVLQSDYHIRYDNLKSVSML